MQNKFFQLVVITSFTFCAQIFCGQYDINQFKPGLSDQEASTEKTLPKTGVTIKSLDTHLDKFSEKKFSEVASKKINAEGLTITVKASSELGRENLNECLNKAVSLITNPEKYSFVKKNEAETILKNGNDIDVFVSIFEYSEQGIALLFDISNKLIIIRFGGNEGLLKFW